MKKFFLSFFVFATSAGYVVYQSTGGSSASAVTTLVTSQSNTQISAMTPQSIKVTLPTPEVQIVPTQPIVAVTKITPVVTPPPVSKPKPKPKVVPVLPPAPIIPPKPKGQYVDGTYTGSVEDAYYGMVQVQAVILGGRLASVDFLQYPNDRSTSRYINDQAMPILKSEAIQAQSADVSGVSGASETSPAFIQSLGNALAQAKNS